MRGATHCIAAVRPQRQQPEEGAQHILPLGNPGHGVHLQRMPGKQRRHDSAAPASPRHSQQDHEDKRRVHRMKKHIDHVKVTRSRAEQLAVEHERQPRHRMPISVLARQPAEGPGHTLRAQAVQHMGILIHIDRVIVVDEVVVPNGPIDRKSHQHQQCADEQLAAKQRLARLRRHGFSIAVSRNGWLRS